MPKNGRSFSIYEHSASSILQRSMASLDTETINIIKHLTQTKVQSAIIQRSEQKIASKRPSNVYMTMPSLKFEFINSAKLKRQQDITQLIKGTCCTSHAQNEFILHIIAKV